MNRSLGWSRSSSHNSSDQTQSFYPTFDCWNCSLYCGYLHISSGHMQSQTSSPRQVQTKTTFPFIRMVIAGEGGSVGVAGRGVAGTLSHIVKTEGARALYSGIVPGLQRQMAFSAIRIGAYEQVKETYQEWTGVTGGLGLLGVRIAAGVTTGDK